MQDIKMKRLEDNSFDFTVNSSGDFATTDNTDTIVLMNILTDSRAESAQVARSIDRRGSCIGNYMLNESGVETGCKVWTYLGGRYSNEYNGLIEGEILSSTKWMIDKNLCKEIFTEVEYDAVLQVLNIDISFNIDAFNEDLYPITWNDSSFKISLNIGR